MEDINMNLVMLKFRRQKKHLMYIFLFFSFIFLYSLNVRAVSTDEIAFTNISKSDEVDAESPGIIEDKSDIIDNSSKSNDELSEDSKQFEVDDEGEIPSSNDALQDDFSISNNIIRESKTLKVDELVNNDITKDFEAVNEADENSNTTEKTTEDILKLINSGANNIHIPAGIYDFKNTEIKLNKFTTIYGDGSNETILKNVCFVAKSGISLMDLSINGGATIKGVWTHYGEYSNSNIIVLGNHTGYYNVFKYENVNFSNADFASFIKDGPILKSDSANNCNFTNIKKIAIYHTTDSMTSSFTNNTFKAIGDSSTLTGVVSGIFIGDVCNITYTQSYNCTIDHNTFEDLYTADDPDMNRHVLNGNFIAVRARRCTISNNTLSNVHGYGEDREAIYTKVMYLSVINNTVINGGYGEGYITCKGQDGENAFAIVSGNTITGTYGSGIYTYGASQVKGNNIEISNCKLAIIAHPRSCSTNRSLSISNNVINCNQGYYYLNGKKMSDVSKGLICVDGQQCNVSIQANRITILDNSIQLGAAILLSNVSHDVNISSNIIKNDIKNSCGIAFTSNKKFFIGSKKSNVIINGNNITASDLAIQIIFENYGGLRSDRFFTIANNKLSGSTTSKYGIYLSCGDNNNDTLDYTTKYAKNYLSNILYTNCQNLVRQDATITLQKKN